MRDELARAYARSWRRGDMGEPHGRLALRPGRLHGRGAEALGLQLPLGGREAKPEELVAEAERLERRLIFVPDPGAGSEACPWFAEHGWRTDRHRRDGAAPEPERTADLSLVSELDEEVCDRARRQLLEGQPWATPEVVEQLFRAQEPDRRTRDDAASSASSSTARS